MKSVQKSPETPALGVCYYPEHWPSDQWPAQARRMRELGIDCVRIGEFAWSRLEPARDQFQFEWFDQAVHTLADAGLRVIIGTPTACPPKWLVDELPEILPCAEDGSPRGFGSRRHYCFSSAAYQRESDRIVGALAARYGQHPAVCGWQLDNEYAHHGTVLSYSPDAQAAFRHWLAARYQTIEHLNQAWGNVFWSMEYSSFAAIDPPIGAVTEMNPSHRLAWRRFSSDQVARFHRRQAKIVRGQVADDVWITHNFIGNFFAYDHHQLTADLDLATWDSYPLGFLEQLWFSTDDQRDYRRTGHPDLAAFHHDLYRGVGAGRWGVMEQQPGPVNWAPYNAVPLPGMVRLWGCEAVAHGAELVSYFRWQQAPFAQEQMHAGLNYPNGDPAPASAEVGQLAKDLAQLGRYDLQLGVAPSSQVALLFDYPSHWIGEIQPHNADYDVAQVAFEFYSAIRRLGLNVDIVSSRQQLKGYELIIAPCLLSVDDDLVSRLRDSGAELLFGPRAGGKTDELSIPLQLPPAGLQQLMPLQVTDIDTLRPGLQSSFEYRQQRYWIDRWQEHIRSDLVPSARTDDGLGVYYEHGKAHYLAGLPCAEFLQTIIEELCERAGIATTPLEAGLRLRRCGALQFAFNFGPGVARVDCDPAQLILGEQQLEAGQFAIWQVTK